MHCVCKLLFLAINIVVITSVRGQEDESPDYSTIFQQFLLQKIREGESWEDLENDSQYLTRARQEVLDVDDDPDYVEIIEDDLPTSSPASDDNEDVTETILNSASYRLVATANSQVSASIQLQQKDNSNLLTLVCDIAANTDSELFKNDACVPEVYLVADQTNCNNLPQVNTFFYQTINTFLRTTLGVFCQEVGVGAWSRVSKSRGGCHLVRAAGQMSCHAAKERL